MNSKTIMSVLVAITVVCTFACLFFLANEGQQIADAREAARQEKLEKQRNYEQSVTDFYSTIQQTLDKRKGLGAEGIALSFYDIDADRLLTTDGAAEFDAISGSRIVLAITVADKLAEGSLTASDKVYFDSTDYVSGESVITENAEGYQVDKLLEYLLVNSDPIAANMLYRKLGGLTSVRKSINQTYSMELNTTENILSANQSMDLLKILYTNKNKNSYYDQIINWMKNSSSQTQLYTEKTAETVAHTAGSNADNHQDVGIFSTEHPYLLVVYSKGLDNAEEEISMLSDELFELMTQNYPKKEK